MSMDSLSKGAKMRSCSSTDNTIGRSRLLFPLAWLLLLTSCPGQYDFDALSNDCTLPNFDIPYFDTYCSGVFQNLGTTAIEGFPGEGAASSHISGDQKDDVIAVGTTTISLDSIDPTNCYQITAQLHVGLTDESGTLTWLGQYPSGDGLTFIASNDNGSGCSRANVIGTWITEVRVLETTDPIRVSAGLLDGGILIADFDRSSGENVSSTRIRPTDRICELKGCVIDVDDEYCFNNQDCHAEAFCDSNHSCRAISTCQASWDSDCQDAEVMCDLGVCRLFCESDQECPHPLVCQTTLQRCGPSVPTCTAGSGDCQTARNCVGGYCLTSCNDDDTCDDGLTCYVDGTTNGCGNPSQLGGCNNNVDCHRPLLGMEIVPSAESDDPFDVLVLTLYNELHTYLLEEDGEISRVWFTYDGNLLTFTDIMSGIAFEHSRRILYIGSMAGNIYRIDLGSYEAVGGSLRGGDLTNYIYVVPAPPSDREPIADLFILGESLVSIEGGRAASIAEGGLEHRDTLARIYQTHADARQDLVQVNVVELGTTLFPTLARFPDRDDSWLFGLDRDLDDTEFVIFEIQDPANPDTFSLIPTDLPEVPETALFPFFSSDGILAGSEVGLTQFRLSVTGSPTGGSR